MEEIPLLEFDQDKEAIIRPEKRKRLPKFCVLLMYNSVINKLMLEGHLEKIDEYPTPFVTINVYQVVYKGNYIAVVNPGIGAPLVVGTFELLIAQGCTKFIACGAAGVLNPELQIGNVIIPSIALRDEGTSYHYCPPSRTIEIDPVVVKKLEAVLLKHDLNYTIGKTWTTDAFFRETRTKVANRKREGCLTVEMECSALIAAAKFHSVSFGQYLAASDDVSGNNWNPRSIDDRFIFRERLFWLSIEACMEL
jgi:uridine phosphorylase